MSTRALFVSLFLWVSAATPASAAEPAEPPEARVRAGLEATGDVWVGQQIGLTVDILSTGSTFAKQRIHLPAVAGALVLEDAVTTINLSERIDGETWQVLRYRYPMFVQRAGPIEVPPIDVAFEVSAGYGRTGVAFDMVTDEMSLSVLRPPGVTEFESLVTTTQFKLDIAVTPTAIKFQVGDALTRTITRAAKGVSGMAFAPLPLPELAGVAVYPDTPLIDDRSNRGELQGKRVDAITFVLQAAGEVTLPAAELQWWDPTTAELHVETIPALTLTVMSNPALTDAMYTNPEANRRPLVWAYLVLAIALCLIGWAVTRGLPKLTRRLRTNALTRARSEQARFKKLQSACRKNDAVLAYNAYLNWVSTAQAPASTLLDSPALRLEREKVQQALISGDGHWRGAAFAQATRNTRRQQQNSTNGSTARKLATLNPTEANGA